MYRIPNFKCITACAWTLLGFNRGFNSYDYHNKSSNLKTTNSFYIDKLGWGLASIVIYLNPVTFFFVLYKEIYRLEVNLRGLEDEKKTEYYNKVFF